MHYENKDTIFALSSGGLPSGVAIIRISGPAVRKALNSLCSVMPDARKATVRDICDSNGETLDRGIVLFFNGPASFTGEDCAELQIHGGKAVVKAVLSSLSDLDGLRPATAGEFTRRAFENGKLDLVEVEGLADLVQAETEMQRKFARYMSEGHLSRRYQDWMQRLAKCRALIEAELDFADEGDVPGSVSDQVWVDVEVLREEMAGVMGGRSAEIIREGFRVAIAGKPNAGKSSLLNYLAKRDIAIVTDIAGTTRDVLKVDLDVDGYKVSFYDTAGLRETDDVVEKIGIARAQDAITASDLVLVLCDVADRGRDLSAFVGELNCPILSVATKSDLAGSGTGNADLSISVVTGEGIDSLLKRITSFAAEAAGEGDFETILLSRHRNDMISSLELVEEALRDSERPLEIRAEQLRLAADHLGKITGAVRADELLGLIFSEFCIGK